MRALVVDDDETNRKLLSIYLKPYGSCDLAENGDKAVELFAKSVQDRVFYDLVCLDIMMPGRDGIATLKAMREIEDAADVFGQEKAKILMITAVADKNIVVDAFKLGCQGYVIKPLERDEVVRQLGNLKLIAT